ncbi:MAG: hypothetical protein QOE09_1561 [Ilumatobacteraceae bacterium]|jgi:uncharacterized integral membrane protein
MSDVTTTEGQRTFSLGHAIHVLVRLLLLVAIVVFALVNTDKVNVDWVARKSAAPLWLIIAVSAVAGAIIGSIARVRRRL